MHAAGKPELQQVLNDPELPGLQKLVKLFFVLSKSSQAAGHAFVARLAGRTGEFGGAVAFEM